MFTAIAGPANNPGLVGRTFVDAPDRPTLRNAQGIQFPAPSTSTPDHLARPIELPSASNTCRRP